MRYSASEKFEIIELVEQSSLSIRRTLAPIGIPRSTFYDWYSRYQEGGIEALVDGKPRPRRIWNKIPDKIETAIVNLALEEPDLSPRELAVNFTDTKGSFVSEATVYRLLKDHGLITSPAFIHEPNVPWPGERFRGDVSHGSPLRPPARPYRDAALGAAAVTRQTVLPTSSATSSAPVLSMATPTGRPRA
jgi:transposase-like protein